MEQNIRTLHEYNIHSGHLREKNIQYGTEHNVEPTLRNILILKEKNLHRETGHKDIERVEPIL